MLLAIHLGMTLMLVILGIVFSKGKGAFLIAGYNTASKAEKQKTDEKKLCKFMGRLMFLLAACWLVLPVLFLIAPVRVAWCESASVPVGRRGVQYPRICGFFEVRKHRRGFLSVWHNRCPSVF